MQDGKVDRSGAHSGQKHGQQVAVNAERWPCAPAVQQRKLAQLRRDGGCHVPSLQAERIEQAAGRHLVVGRHGCRAEQRGVSAGERLAEKQLTQLRCQRHENGSCRYADETHSRNGSAGQNTHACLLTDRLRCRDGGQQRRADRADERDRKQQQRHGHARDHAERGQRLLIVQTGRHQALRQQDGACRAEHIADQRRGG